MRRMWSKGQISQALEDQDVVVDSLNVKKDI
jgi:hypothetical protein